MTTVAYLVDRYPRLSQTFVSNEIAELRRRGFTVPVITLEPGDRLGDATDVAGDVAADDVFVLRDFRPVSVASRVRTKLTRRRDGHVLAALTDEIGGGDGQIPAWKLPALARHLRRRGVDRIHAHFAWQAAGAAWALAAQLDVPWSMTVHANDIFSRRRNLDAKLAAADRVVTVCEYNVDYLRGELGVERDVDVVVCGVDVPAVADLPDRKTTDVVAVGRLVDKKGIDLLLRAVDHVRHELPSVRVTIVGDGPERARLERMSRDLDVTPNVTFTGAASHEEALRAIGEARVFAFPARIAASGDRDSMPVVIKEAMARCVPVVATDIVAIPEMVDAEVGRLVPPDDEHALAKAICELLHDDELATRLGNAGRRRVEQRFTLQDEVAKLAAIFEGSA
jgi:colanic acid/amylovoran biosynthesis glycosyltransferase